MLNNNNNNNKNINNNNINSIRENKQLSVKAYFINKYEQLKDPTQNLMNDSHFNAFLMDGMNMNQVTLPNTLVQQGIDGTFGGVNGSNKHNNSISSMLNANKNKRNFSNGSNSDLQNSDDDDDDYDDASTTIQSKEEKRRISHTAAEQKRRNAIKHGYDELQSLVPSCEYMDPSSSQKVCKATILKRSIDYINELEQEHTKNEQDVESLKKEIIALTIMKSNYEEILRCHRNIPKGNNIEVNDETKFELFTKIADHLFQTFDRMTSTNSFTELSGTMLNWVEQICTAQNLRHLIFLSLMQIQQMLN